MIRQITLAATAMVALSGCATMTAPVAPSVAAPPPAAAVRVAPDSMRWLYGSGEGAAASIQALRALADYVVRNSVKGPASIVGAVPRMTVPMGLGNESEQSLACGAKPEAVIFDVDETLLLNLGYEYWQASTRSAYSSDIWDEWERRGYDYVAPAPGAITALKRIRESGVTVIFNTNRNARNADGTIAALRAAGLGEAVHGQTLFLKGDDNLGSGKDGRRASIAAKYCVLAMAGDNLGDFSDRLNDRSLSPAPRRELAAHGDVAKLWGNGWFILPNPVYGAAIAGDIDDIFPQAARWMPRETSNKGQ